MFAFAALGMAEGDEKKLATASLAYKNIANAVLTATPAEKFKVMEESFKVAARQATAKSFEFFLNITMAKVVALLLAAIAISAVLVQVECDAPVEKSFNKALLAPVDKRLDEATQAINEAADSVVAAAPPAKKAEIEDATWKHRMYSLRFRL
uniref:Uncharacterized protein n=1 Tax=Oryza glumipatula TaxID=40148 RepID=A0A0E0B3Q2_9ORYZ